MALDPLSLGSLDPLSLGPLNSLPQLPVDINELCDIGPHFSIFPLHFPLLILLDLLLDLVNVEFGSELFEHQFMKGLIFLQYSNGVLIGLFQLLPDKLIQGLILLVLLFQGGILLLQVLDRLILVLELHVLSLQMHLLLIRCLYSLEHLLVLDEQLSIPLFSQLCGFDHLCDSVLVAAITGG